MTPEEIKKLKDEINETWAAMKAAMLKQAEEIKASGHATAETEVKIAKMGAQLDALEVKINRPAVDPMTTEKKEQDEKVVKQKAAFAEFCRKGRDGMSPDNLKVLTVGDNTTGGYLAPPEYVNEIIKGLINENPIRSVARVRQTMRSSIQWPKRTQTAAASRTSEVGTRAETTNPKWGLEEIPTHEYYALVPVSFWDLEDSIFNLEGELNQEFTEQFALAESIDFLTGTGVGMPEGILTNAAVGEKVSGHATLIQADGLMDLQGALKAAYQRNSTFLFSPTTLTAIRKLKYATGEYIWVPGFSETPATILGRPYLLCDDMPAIGAGTYPVAYGDFSKGYLIVDRIQMIVQRDPFTAKKSGAVEFDARKRVGGQVILAEAIKKLKISV